MRHLLNLRFRGLAALPFAVVHSAFGLVASDPAQTDIAVLLGADRFYAEGITGQGASAAIIEGGLVWSGDASTAHVTDYFAHEDTWVGDFGDERDLWDRHATWSGSLLGGRGATPERTGIAPAVDLQSGATATRWVGTAYTTSWAQTVATVDAAYEYFAETAPVDVISSSWGFRDSSASSSVTIGIDALAYDNPSTLLVAASGNSGFSSNSVVSPASAMNVVSVGGVGYADGAFDERWASSGRGLSDYYDPVNGLISGVRASVDILAPSQNLSALRYGGATGGNNSSLSGSFEVPARDSSGLFGTSFSTPIAAGAAALFYSLSQETMPTNAESRDARVVKAIMLNSADKLDGWSAAIAQEDGVWTTRQGLDAAQGAGRLNLDRGFDQYAMSPTNLSGVDGLGASPALVLPSGWDLSELGNGESYFFELADSIEAGSWLTGTLVWYRERRTVNGSDEDLKQADFNLYLWSVDLETRERHLVGQSISEYNLVEHLDLEVEQAGSYLFEVRYDDDVFKQADASDSEAFAFAWDLAAVPEPSGLVLAFGLMASLAVSVRRR
ncbi:MAG: S8 family serine peptidase [Opitutaceae bacterium]